MDYDGLTWDYLISPKMLPPKDIVGIQSSMIQVK